MRFEKGQRFGEVRFELTPDAVREYVAAVEDGAVVALGGDAVPPMAVAAYAVRGLLSEMPLPPGSIHAGQELEFVRPVGLGETLAVTGRVLSAGERKGWTLATVELDVRDGAGQPVMCGRATLTAPVEAA
ncbi:MAG: MaoC family dehydratase [Dehalococcoidia bacterium]